MRSESWTTPPFRALRGYTVALSSRSLKLSFGCVTDPRPRADHYPEEGAQLAEMTPAAGSGRRAFRCAAQCGRLA